MPYLPFPCVQTKQGRIPPRLPLAASQSPESDSPSRCLRIYLPIGYVYAFNTQQSIVRVPRDSRTRERYRIPMPYGDGASLPVRGCCTSEEDKTREKNPSLPELLQLWVLKQLLDSVPRSSKVLSNCLGIVFFPKGTVGSIQTSAIQCLVPRRY